MNSEQRKIYNKNYYKLNKQKFYENEAMQARCPSCNSVIITYNIDKHLRSTICKRKSQKYFDYIKYHMR